MIGDDVYWQATGNFLRKYLYLLWLITSMLSVFPFYVFTCRGSIQDQEMKKIFFVFFICGICAYYGGLNQQMAYALYVDSGQEEYTVTSVYSLLSLLPLVLLFKNKQLLQFVLLATIFIYLVLSSKRGAVMLGAISSIILVFSMFAQSTLKKKLNVLLISIICLAGIYLFVNHLMETSQYFSDRIDRTMEGYVSKRDEYIKIIWDYYINSTNIRQFFFGIGAQGTLSVNETFAHNDWLAILLEHGVLGGLLYLLYWLCFVISWIKVKLNNDSFVAIGLLLLIGFGKSIFSMYYLPISAEMMTSSGFFAAALGFYLGKAYPQQNICSIKIVSK